MVSSLAHSSTLKMEATCSVETSVDIQRPTRRCILKYRTLTSDSVSRLRLHEGKITCYLKSDSDNMKIAEENTFLHSHVLGFRCLFYGGTTFNMPAPLTECTKEERCSLIQFLWSESVKTNEVERIQYGDSCMSHKNEGVE
jgi:hypothetical protein